MTTEKSWYSHGKKFIKLKRVRFLAITVLVIVSAIGLFSIFSRIRVDNADEKRVISNVWNSGDFEEAYRLSRVSLAREPVDFFLLTVNGFSAYQLGISQINIQNRLFYIDESIKSLRKALLLKDAEGDGRIYYVLGKSYYYKGSDFADLAIKYLEMADALSYNASDIPEFLGLSYAAIGDYRNSVRAFSQAFDPERTPSDTLLLSIARSYMSMEEYPMAIGYLQRCIEGSPDSRSIIIAQMLLAEIYKLSGDYDSAERQYLSILETSGENAEVRFQLGELYNLRGETIRARAEWRIAHREDPAHIGARARLNI